MTVLPRGAKNRRSGRRPGWLLLTALLVLAILASTTLVFTNRVELLRLAVILSLWAAVLAAFVSVIYRRQSQLDAAKARDMKYVYDLQLDREISARREYELSVEAHLRRQLVGELRAQEADEMAALRAELASLRANLAALLGTDLGDRPALESDRAGEPALAPPLSMPMPPAPGRVQSSRVTPVPSPAGAVTEVTHVAEVTVTHVEVVEEVAEVAAESPIIDVPEEPLAPAAPPPAAPYWAPPPSAGYRAAPPPAPVPGPDAGRGTYRGSHRRGADGPWATPAPQPFRAQQAPPVPPPPPARSAPPPPAPPAPPAAPPTPWRPPETRTRPGRHRTFEEQAAQPGSAGRHRNAAPADNGAAAGRHRTAEEAAQDAAGDTAVPESQGQHAGGAPVADLMARLRANQGDSRSSGGGRRRRED